MKPSHERLLMEFESASAEAGAKLAPTSFTAMTIVVVKLRLGVF